jgi:hypothetical protein
VEGRGIVFTALVDFPLSMSEREVLSSLNSFLTLSCRISSSRHRLSVHKSATISAAISDIIVSYDATGLVFSVECLLLSV